MARVRELTFSSERWEFRTPFRISGRTFTSADLLLVSISQDARTGRGEGAGVYYLDETGASMMADVASVRDAIEAGADRHQLRGLLPNGGARNALDCALWDLEAKQKNTTIWELTGIEPRTTRTVLTIGIGSPEEMAATAASLDADRLKVKLDCGNTPRAQSQRCAQSGLTTRSSSTSTRAGLSTSSPRMHRGLRSSASR